MAQDPPPAPSDAPTLIALAGCAIARPRAFAGAVEIVAASAAPRAFPTHVNESLGVCLKRGPAHRVTANGEQQLYPDDTICVRAPGCTWSCEAAPAAFLSIDIAPSLLPPDLEPRSMRYLRPSRALDVRRFARALAGADPLACQEGLVELVSALVAHAGVSGARSLSAGAVAHATQRARERLACSLAESLNLDQLALEVGANKYVLIRQFRREIGTTPHNYRNLLRVERARTLLARGLALGEVAGALGFADQAHFSRQFKRVLGVTPGSYARNVRRTVSGWSRPAPTPDTRARRR